MRIKKLFSSLTRQQTIKIVSFLVIVGLFFVVPTFAQDNQNAELEKTTTFLQNVITICSRGWVILATLAGKLMTNDFVYGSFIHMDIYLWKIWNIMKNFANFTLIALVIGSIIKSLIGKEAIDVKKIITNTLIAGILIQASWFMMGALIDLSTIATVAISGFPSSFIQSNDDMKKTMNNNAAAFNNKTLVYDMHSTDPKNSIQVIDDNDTTSNIDTDIWKKFLPTSNSISGPFVYMGMGIFQFQKIMTIGTSQNIITMSLTFALRFLLIFFFTVALLLLVIANIMRIGLLRIFIIGAPFLILILLFKVKTGDGIGKLFSLPNLMTLIFKPVIFVAAMSIMLIVVMSMYSVLMNSGTQITNINGITFNIEEGGSIMSLDGISTVKMEQNDLFGKDVLDKTQNSFAMLLVMLLSIFLMWRIVKLSLTLGSGPIEDTMEKMTGRAESMAKSMPILPFKGGGASFNAVKGFKQQQLTEIKRGFGMDREGNFDEAEQNFQHMIDDKMNIQSSWTKLDYNTIDAAITTGGINNFFNVSQKIGHKRQGGLSLTNSTWKAQLEKYLEKNPNNPFTVSDSKATGFDKYFKGTGGNAANNRKILHDYMGGDVYSKYKLSNNTISYENLLNNVYTNKPDK